MDASITYGFNETLSRQIRSNKSGLLISSKESLLPIINDTVAPSDLQLESNVENIAAGDPRVNLDPWLLSVQTMIFKEHNRLATEIHSQIPATNADEHTFEHARRIVIAEYQNIIFNEFIPIVIGNEAMHKYDLWTNTTSKYDDSIDPTIHNGFQTAAARFGHSMVQVFNLKILTHFNDLNSRMQ